MKETGQQSFVSFTNTGAGSLTVHMNACCQKPMTEFTRSEADVRERKDSDRTKLVSYPHRRLRDVKVSSTRDDAAAQRERQLMVVLLVCFFLD